MAKHLQLEIKVGIFVALGVGLIMAAILLLGGANSFFSKNNHYNVHFPSVEGLLSGAKVVLGGLQVGTVHSVDFDPQLKNVKVTLDVGKKYEEWIRKDSTAEILTQGVLGDKYISIAQGMPESPILPSQSEIPNKPSANLAQFINKGDQLMISLNSIATSLDHLLKSFESEHRSEVFFSGMATTARNLANASQKLNAELDHLRLKSVTANLNSVLEKVNNGTGTLGALVNDPGLYYDLKSLLGGANRNRVIRNLVRKTIKNSDEKTGESQNPK